MKKRICLIMAAVLTLTLAGCSADGRAADDAALGGTVSADLADSRGYADAVGDFAAEDSEGDIAVADSFADEAASGAVEEIGEDVGELESVSPYAGLLTGGEWCDNEHWDYWNELYDTQELWSEYRSDWGVSYDFRIEVAVTADGQPLEGARVSCGEAAAVTDNSGTAYIFCSAPNGQSEPITVTFGGESAVIDGVYGDARVECSLDVAVPMESRSLDLMIMCDTTGSMSDELVYLQEELADVISRICSENANMTLRTSVNFYRDEGDEYVVREYPFTADADEAVQAIREQSADGGGDYPEAVHTALDSALNNHDWDEDAVKIMFLVLDAPPHSDTEIVESVNSLIGQASEMGVRIIPVASSGVDKTTEYLLRTMAFMTGGTYTFLTDDSGVGGSHIQPTVGAYNVEQLNDMMVRIVNGYLD